MGATMEPVRLAGSVLNRSRHVCAFFHSKEEEYDVLMPFIKEGFEKGDRAAHGGGRAAEPTPRARQAAFVQRGDEDFHRVDSVHVGSVLRVR